MFSRFRQKSSYCVQQKKPLSLVISPIYKQLFASQDYKQIMCFWVMDKTANAAKYFDRTFHRQLQ